VDLIIAMLLGIVQGLTEFLPISSTAHLTIAEKVFLDESLPLAFDALMHVGTLVALMVYFRRELVKVAMGLIGKDSEGARLAWLLFIAMIPTGILAMSTKPFKEAAKGYIWLYGVFLVVTAMMLWGANHLAKRRPGRAIAEMNVWDALCIGAIQGLGGGFGLSRSGSTISVGVFRGVNLSESTRFSFLLGIPTIAAAAIVEGGHLVKEMFQNDGGVQQVAWFQSGATSPILLSIVGICAAGVSGYFALGLLSRFTSKPRLGGFVIYCFVVGAAILVFYGVLPQIGSKTPLPPPL